VLKKTQKPTVDIKDDVSSGSDLEEYQFECSDVSSEDEDPSKKTKSSRTGKSEVNQEEEDLRNTEKNTEKNREEQRKKLEMEAQEAKRKRLIQEGISNSCKNWRLSHIYESHNYIQS